MPGKLFERDMGRLIEWAVEMCGRGQRTEVGVSCFILRIEGKPVIGRRNGIRPIGPRNREQGPDDWLHASRLAGLGEFHDPV